MAAGSAGLDRDSVALCHQVTTLDRAKLLRLMGILSPAQLEQVAEALRFSLAI
jgi:mRNA-degrading endonuclease toxin of MazEF toxin-antitoxin module